MKAIKTLFCSFLVSLMFLSIFSGCGGNGDSATNAALEDISVKTTPKTEYILGEEFEIAGGVLELQYDDGTKKALAFTADGVTVSKPDMTTPGNKNVTVEYDGFTDSYMITVGNAKFTVTFDLNYDDAPDATKQSVLEEDYAARPSADPTRSGYRFIGWFTDKATGTEFDFSETKITSDITLYAHWTEVNTVTFNYNYGGAPAASSVSVDKGGKLQETLAPVATREGYLFNGWHTDATEDSAYTFGAVVDSSFTLYAHWTKIEDGKTIYNVTFNYNYFEYTDKVVKVVEGGKVSKPQNPEGEERTFDAWYTQAEGGDKYDFNEAVTKDLTLYAHWNVSKYVVNFRYIIDGNETTLRTRKVSPGGTVAAGSVPVVTGYKFVSEWYTDATYTTKFDFKTPVNADYNLYVKPLKENKFEAEYTYIDENKAGVGSSDNFSGLKLIFADNGTASSSNGYWVSGLYYNTAFIEFVITSDKAVTDAHLQLRLSAEWADMYLAPNNQSFGGKDYYGFEISSAPALLDSNGKVKKDSLGYTLFDASQKLTFDYAPIAITGAISFEQSMVDKRPFTDYTMTTSFALREGVNVIRLTVTNSHAPYDGTMEASAPMIDCISIFTDATLTWNPLKENVADPGKLNG